MSDAANIACILLKNDTSLTGFGARLSSTFSEMFISQGFSSFDFSFISLLSDFTVSLLNSLFNKISVFFGILTFFERFCDVLTSVLVISNGIVGRMRSLFFASASRCL